MKKTIINAVIFIAILILPVLFFSCRKEKGILESTSQNKLDILPVSVPTFYSNQQINDHLRNLAYGFASMFDTMFLANDNRNAYKTGVEGLIKTDDDEVALDYLNNNLNPYILSSKLGYSPYDVYSTMIEAINWNSPNYQTFHPRPWSSYSYDWQAYPGFEYKQTIYYTLLRIPDWEALKSDQSRLTKKVLVIPNEVDTNDVLITPIIGYYMDTVLNEVDSIMFQTEEEMEDDDRFYIWVVDYDSKMISNNSNNSPCSGDGAPVQNDDYCDGDCGETEGNSPLDCNPSFLRKVWIDEVTIKEDYKQKCGTNYQWMESRLAGSYEIGYSSMTPRANGKVSKRGGFINDRIRQRDVTRSRKLGPGCAYKSSIGGSGYKNGLTSRLWFRNDWGHYANEEKDKSKQPLPILATEFRPWKDTLYLIMYEWDLPTTNESRTRKVEVYYRNGIKTTMEYYCKHHEGAFADKRHSNNIFTYGSGPYDRQVIMVTPSMWGTIMPGSLSGDVIIYGSHTSSGSFPDRRAITVKLKYGQ